MPNTSDPGGPFLGTVASVSKSEAARQRQKRMREMDSEAIWVSFDVRLLSRECKSQIPATYSNRNVQVRYVLHSPTVL